MGLWVVPCFPHDTLVFCEYSDTSHECVHGFFQSSYAKNFGQIPLPRRFTALNEAVTDGELVKLLFPCVGVSASMLHTGFTKRVQDFKKSSKMYFVIYFIYSP